MHICHYLCHNNIYYCGTLYAVIVFSKYSIEGGWKRGEHKLPKVSSYSYLGIDFASNGAWDVHLKKVLDNGRKKVNQLHSVISRAP